MATVSAPTVFPYVPETITVHLGPPNSDAPNVTVPFADYVKNVASSEIYPTWDESALRANILAITSFALNRIYTEYYRSRGYDFDITNSTAIDQAYVEGRSYFDNISRLADELFNDYLRRPGAVEPLAAKFCNGTTVTCEGLSQWGSENLARDGLDSVGILRYYYGEDLEIVTDAPVRGITESYPGTPIRLGDTGPYVTVVQSALNRIGRNYPAIPRVPVDGKFGPQTETAVRAFQQIFSLEEDGIVGRGTWYQINRAYVAILRLAELQSEGQRQYAISGYPSVLQSGDSGEWIRLLQYLLAVTAYFIPQVETTAIDGVFGENTRRSVVSFQRYAGLPETGVVDAGTWTALLRQFRSIEAASFSPGELLPLNIGV